MACAIKQCLEFSPFPTPQSVCIVDSGIKSHNNLTPYNETQCTRNTMNLRPQRACLCSLWECCWVFIFGSLCVIQEVWQVLKEGSWWPLPTGDHGCGPVGTPSLQWRFSRQWNFWAVVRAEHFAWHLSSGRLSSELGFPQWKTGLCHLVSVPEPVTARVGVEGLWWRVSGVGQAQLLSSRCSVSWQAGEAQTVHSEDNGMTGSSLKGSLEEGAENCGKGGWRLVKPREALILKTSLLKNHLWFLPHLYHCLFWKHVLIKNYIYFKRKL